MRIHLLKEPFPKLSVHWRSQSMNREGTKALALAFLDARDIQDRLDLVCGPANWQTRFTETPRGRILCQIGIRHNDDWVWKSDGAGETAVEGEKGGISDALKRAAVSWGIGRYLYRIDAPWVPCESYERNKKNVFRRWKENPWDYVKDAPAAPEDKARDFYAQLLDADNVAPIVKKNQELLLDIEVLVPDVYRHVMAKISEKEKEASKK